MGVKRPWITLSFVKPGRCDSHLADLADTASLAQGADRSHVALVPGAELRRAVVGRRFQCDAGMDFPRSMKMVALTMQWNMQWRQQWSEGKVIREKKDIYIYILVVSKLAGDYFFYALKIFTSAAAALKAIAGK